MVTYMKLLNHGLFVSLCWRFFVLSSFILVSWTPSPSVWTLRFESLVCSMNPILSVVNYSVPSSLTVEISYWTLTFVQFSFGSRHTSFILYSRGSRREGSHTHRKRTREQTWKSPSTLTTPVGCLYYSGALEAKQYEKKVDSLKKYYTPSPNLVAKGRLVVLEEYSLRRDFSMC